MLTFIVPVKSKVVSGSWKRFSDLFERALKSITNQTSDAFQVVVVCHEKPDISFDHPKVHYIHVDFPPPQLDPAKPELHRGLKEEDKSKKILAGVEYVKDHSSDYIMVTDADDCISNKIAAIVESNVSSDVPGWYFQKGYVYQEGSKIIYLNRSNFSMICGSGIIVKPELIHHIFVKRPHLHYAHETKVLTPELPMTPFPIPGTVYSMANSENHYMSTTMLKNRIVTANTNKWKAIKRLLKKISNNRPKLLGRRIRREFGLYQLTS